MFWHHAIAKSEQAKKPTNCPTLLSSDTATFVTWMLHYVHKLAKIFAGYFVQTGWYKFDF